MDTAVEKIKEHENSSEEINQNAEYTDTKRENIKEIIEHISNQRYRRKTEMDKREQKQYLKR